MEFCRPRDHDPETGVPTTFHMTPATVWKQQRSEPEYTPEAFATDGFIHCTDGVANMIATANRYYTGDPRNFVCLELDVDLITAEVRYEDPDQIYPHIYGLLNTDAVVAIRSMTRDADGRFLSLGDATDLSTPA
jgi:uncharacterized protein (DUF952 family)